MKEKVIFTRKLAYQLNAMGFKIIEVRPNPHHPQYDCYVFEETEEFLEIFYKLANPAKHLN